MNSVRVITWLLAGLALGSCSALAHKPLDVGGSFPEIDQALEIADISVSQVVYTELTSDQPAVWLTFQVRESSELYLSLGAPRIDRLAATRPWIAVLGPGLPTVDVPFSIPEGYGAIVFGGGAVSEGSPFYEPFTGTDSWIPVEETVRLETAGAYYVVAWLESAEAGKIWVAIGTREQFGWRDILSLPTVIRDVRAFHEVPPRRPVVSWQAALVLLLAAGMAVVAFSRSAGPAGCF